MSYEAMTDEALSRLYDRIAKKIKAAQARDQVKAVERHQADLAEIRAESARRLKT